MPQQSARDIVDAHRGRMQAMRAGFNNVPSADPYSFVADDGTKFNDRATMTSYNMELRARDQGNRTFSIMQNRLYRRA